MRNAYTNTSRTAHKVDGKFNINMFHNTVFGKANYNNNSKNVCVCECGCGVGRAVSWRTLPLPFQFNSAWLRLSFTLSFLFVRIASNRAALSSSTSASVCNPSTVLHAVRTSQTSSVCDCVSVCKRTMMHGAATTKVEHSMHWEHPVRTLPSKIQCDELVISLCHR